MIQDFLAYLNKEGGVIVAIVAFGIIPLGIVIYLVDAFLKAIGWKDVAEFMGALLTIPIGITWIGGFVLSGLLYGSRVNGLKILLILIGLFLIALTYSALNYREIRGAINSEKGLLKKKWYKTKKSR